MEVGNFIFKPEKQYKLGKGAYGDVYKAWYRNCQCKKHNCKGKTVCKKLYAMKVMGKENLDGIPKSIKCGHNIYSTTLKRKEQLCGVCEEMIPIDSEILYCIKCPKYYHLSPCIENKRLSDQSEVDLLRHLEGNCDTHIMKIYKTFQDIENLYVVTEYCEDGDVEAFLKKEKWVKEPEVIRMMDDIFCGLCFLQSFNIIHRDIKPANVMRHNGKYKLIDYGLSKIIKKNFRNIVMNTPYRGSPVYEAPEVYLPLTDQYTNSVDTFSAGVMLYEALYREFPWWSWKQQYPNQLTKQDVRTYLTTKTGKNRFPRQPPVSDKMKKLLTKMLIIKPWKDRLTPLEIRKDDDFKALIRQNQSDFQEEKKEGLLYLSKSFCPNQKKDSHAFCTDHDKHKKPGDYHDTHQAEKNPKNCCPHDHGNCCTHKHECHEPNDHCLCGPKQKKSKAQKKSIENFQIPDRTDLKAFDQINQKIKWKIFRVKLINKTNFLLQKYNHFFKEIEDKHKKLLIFALSKYQCIIIKDLINKIAEKKNFLNEEDGIWKRYLKSYQYKSIILEANDSFQKSIIILKKIFNELSKKIEKLFNTKGKSLSGFFVKSILKISSDLSEMESTMQCIDFVKKEYLSKLNFGEQNSHLKLIIMTFLVYTFTFEKIFRFNPNNNITFDEVIARIEKSDDSHLKNILGFQD